MRKKLTPKQARFVEEYLASKDLNASEAYKRAGYKATGNAAGVEAHRLLKNPNIAKHIESAREERSKRTQVSADDVIRQLVRMGFADIRKLFTPQGQLKPLHELDDDTAAAIASIEVVTKEIPMPGDEPPEIEYVHKVKMVDKIKPLELIGRHMGKQLGEWADRREHTGKDGGPIQHDVKAISADMDPVEASRIYREHLNANKT